MYGPTNTRLPLLLFRQYPVTRPFFAMLLRRLNSASFMQCTLGKQSDGTASLGVPAVRLSIPDNALDVTFAPSSFTSI